MNYEVTAVFPGRGVSRLQLAADSPDQLTALPALQGGVIVSFRCVGQHAARRRGKFPLPLFTRQLLSLLQAGLTVVEGLETLAAQDRVHAVALGDAGAPAFHADLPGLMAALPHLRAVAFNGGKSARLGHRILGADDGRIARIRSNTGL